MIKRAWFSFLLRTGQELAPHFAADLPLLAPGNQKALSNAGRARNDAVQPAPDSHRSHNNELRHATDALLWAAERLLPQERRPHISFRSTTGLTKLYEG